MKNLFKNLVCLFIFILITSCSTPKRKLSSTLPKYLQVLFIPSKQLIAVIETKDLNTDENIIKAKIKISPFSREKDNKVSIGKKVKEIDIEIPNFKKMKLHDSYKLPIMNLSPKEKWLIIVQQNYFEVWDTENISRLYTTIDMQKINKNYEKFFLKQIRKKIQTFSQEGLQFWFNNYFRFAKNDHYVAFYDPYGHIIIFDVKNKRPFTSIRTKLIENAHFTPLMDLSNDARYVAILSSHSKGDSSNIYIFDTDANDIAHEIKLKSRSEPQINWTEKLNHLKFTYGDERLHLVASHRVDERDHIFIYHLNAFPNQVIGFPKEIYFEEKDEKKKFIPTEFANDGKLIASTINHDYKLFLLNEMSDLIKEGQHVDIGNINANRKQVTYDIKLTYDFNFSELTFFMDTFNHFLYYTDHNNIYWDEMRFFENRDNDYLMDLKEIMRFE